MLTSSGRILHWILPFDIHNHKRSRDQKWTAESCVIHWWCWRRLLLSAPSDTIFSKACPSLMPFNGIQPGSDWKIGSRWCHCRYRPKGRPETDERDSLIGISGCPACARASKSKCAMSSGLLSLWENWRNQRIDAVANQRFISIPITSGSLPPKL